MLFIKGLMNQAFDTDTVHIELSRLAPQAASTYVPDRPRTIPQRFPFPPNSQIGSDSGVCRHEGFEMVHKHVLYRRVHLKNGHHDQYNALAMFLSLADIGWRTACLTTESY
jgi:hypothetical protein